MDHLSSLLAPLRRRMPHPQNNLLVPKLQRQRNAISSLRRLGPESKVASAPAPPLPHHFNVLESLRQHRGQLLDGHLGRNGLHKPQALHRSGSVTPKALCKLASPSHQAEVSLHRKAPLQVGRRSLAILLGIPW